MRNTTGAIILLLAAMACLFSCNKSMTYAEKMKEEKEIIQKFISDSGFVVRNDFPADTVFGEKEFVLFDEGIYLNIIDKGEGELFASGNEITVRFRETNLSNGIMLSNMEPSNQGNQPDVFRYSVSGSSQSGTFIYENAIEIPTMYHAYNSMAVPSGWLMPLKYLRDGAHVRLIVPHKFGQSDATYYVYPCYYEIIYGLSKR